MSYPVPNQGYFCPRCGSKDLYKIPTSFNLSIGCRGCNIRWTHYKYFDREWDKLNKTIETKLRRERELNFTEGDF